MKKQFLILTICIITTLNLLSQSNGVSSVFQLASIGHTTYLIDTLGNTYNNWQCSANAASTAYLLKDGSIMRPYRLSNTPMSGGAVGGGLQIIDWNNNVTWDYTWSNNDHQQHHECIPIEQEDGTYHALLIAWERKNNTAVIQAGRQNTNGEMWPTEIVEIQPVGFNGGNIIWEWHAWDHLCQDVDPSKDNYYTDCSQHPELFDVNIGNTGGGPQGGGDWIHANGIDYSPVLDQIIFSSHFLHEIYVIDRSTTSAEASSHSGGNSGMGGDILYRWGNPGNFGGPGNRELYTVHGANFIDEEYPGAGNLMCFDNQATSNGGSGNSRVIEIIPPLNNSTYSLPWNQTPTWTYSDPGNFYANHLSGAFRLKNGNTMATLGTSTQWREVSMQGNIIYEYNFPGSGNMAKTAVYEIDYPGLIGVVNNTSENLMINSDYNILIYPIPSKRDINILLPSNAKLPCKLTLIDIAGGRITSKKIMQKSININTINYPSGIYFLNIQNDQFSINKKIIIE